MGPNGWRYGFQESWIVYIVSMYKYYLLKPTKLQDFDDGQAFLPYYDYSTSVANFGYFCVILEYCEKPWTHTQIPL